MYTNSQSSMQSIEYNKENHPILNQIYNILVEFQAQNKKITLCKGPAYIRINGNEAEKEAIDMPGMITTRLPCTDYYLTIRRARNSKWQREWENCSNKLHYMKPINEEWESATTVVGNMRLR